jgi:hypothetical protein
VAATTILWYRTVSVVCAPTFFTKSTLFCSGNCRSMVWAVLLIISDQVHIFKEMLQLIEEDDLPATEVAWHFESIRNVGQDDRERFITARTKFLSGLEDSGIPRGWHFTEHVDLRTECTLVVCHARHCCHLYRDTSISQLHFGPKEGVELFDQWQCAEEVMV